MQLQAHENIVLQLQRGEESVRLLWRHFYEDKNTYAVQFFLQFKDITIDCLYGFTDGFAYTLIVNTETLSQGELYRKIIPVFTEIYEKHHLAHPA